MKIWSVSQIGKDGHQSIVVELVEPWVNSRDLWMGGAFLSFELDHIKQVTDVYPFIWLHGVPSGFDKRLNRWKGEILSTDEMLRWADEYRRGDLRYYGNLD